MHRIRVQMAKAQINRSASPLGLQHDAPRHDVARREICRRVISRHERVTPTRRPDARPPPAALLRAEIAAHLRRRARSDETARIPCRRCVRRRGTPVRHRHPSPPPGSSSPETCPAPPVASRSPGQTRDPLPSIVDEANTETAPVLDDGADGERVLEHPNARARRGALPEHAADLAPGGIGRMQNAAYAVRALRRQRRLPVRVAVEPGAPVDQLARVAGPLRTSTRTARSSHRPSPAIIVSRACSSGESSVRSRRRYRPARTRCCSRWDRLS